jgi:hypothetical protein
LPQQQTKLQLDLLMTARIKAKDGSLLARLPDRESYYKVTFITRSAAKHSDATDQFREWQ